MLCRIWLRYFFLSPLARALLTCRGRCVHGLGSHKAEIPRSSLRRGPGGPDSRANQTVCEYFYVAHPRCASRRDRTVAPVKQISYPGGLGPLNYDLHLLWSYDLEHPSTAYSNHSHVLTGDEQAPDALYHPVAAVCERLEVGRW